MKTTLAALSLTLLTFPALSAERGQGAIVMRDDASVYAGSKGDKVERKLGRGDAVAIRVFWSRLSSWESNIWYDEVDGRVQVLPFPNAEQKGASSGGWMDPKDLSRFTLPGICEPSSPHPTPFSTQWWDLCFREAREKKLDSLRATWAAQDAGAPSTAR